MKEYEKIFKALANKRRLEILKFLKGKKEATVGDIARSIKLSFKSTSRHLALLRNAGIIEKEQRSLSCYYSLDTSVSKVAKFVISQL